METIGEILKRYREPRIKLNEFSALVKISEKNLARLEANEFSSLPEDFYVRSYIKLYAKYLQLDYPKLEALYVQQRSGLLPDMEEHVNYQKYAKKHFYITPTMIKVAFLVLFGLSLLGYLLFQLQQTFSAPYLKILYPEKDIAIQQNFIEIRGEVEKESQVFVNDREIFADQEGKFKITLDLKSGINIIKVTATKKHSKESVEYRKILVE
jgi:hypothetical protein